VFESGSSEEGMRFMTNVSTPDGFAVNANESFIKAWRIPNSSTYDWSGCVIAFESGEPMGP